MMGTRVSMAPLLPPYGSRRTITFSVRRILSRRAPLLRPEDWVFCCDLFNFRKGFIYTFDRGPLRHPKALRLKRGLKAHLYLFSEVTNITPLLA